MAKQRQHVATWASGSFLKWRGLSLKEYRQFSERLRYEPELEVYCALYQLVVDHDVCPALDMVPAGVVDFLGRILIADSAFSGDIERVNRTLAAKSVALRNDYFESCKVVMAGVFRYTFEEMDEWDEDVFLDRVAAASLLSGEDLSMKPLEETPKGPRVAQRPPKRPPNPRQQQALERTMQSRRGS